MVWQESVSVDDSVFLHALSAAYHPSNAYQDPHSPGVDRVHYGVHASTMSTWVSFFFPCQRQAPGCRLLLASHLELSGDDLTRAANPNLTTGPNAGDELGELKRRVKKLEEAVAALQAVSNVGFQGMAVTDLQ